MEFHLVDELASVLAFSDGVEDDDEDTEGDYAPNDVGYGGGAGEAELGETEDDLRDEGEFGIGITEHFLEFRNDEYHEEDEDGDGDETDDGRIDHGGDDFVFEFLSFLLVFGEAGEDDFEHTAEFAGFDHVDVEFVENFGVLCEGLGESGATLDGVREVADGGFEDWVWFLFSEDGEGAEEGQAGVDECGELASEDHEDFRLNGGLAFADGHVESGAFGLRFFRRCFCAGGGFAFAFFVNLSGVEALGAEFLNCLGFCGGGHDPVGLLTFGVECGIIIIWHGIFN